LYRDKKGGIGVDAQTLIKFHFSESVVFRQIIRSAMKKHKLETDLPCEFNLTKRLKP
ncbi:hypothetical protein L9F63_017447, partial [Diploptera punctata]